MPPTAKSAVAIQVIERMFSLLDLLARHPEPVSLKDLSAGCGLHPSTAHRILNDLVAGGFVVRHGAGTYKLGPRLMTLGELVKSRLNVRQLGAEALKAWHAKAQLPCALWQRAQHRVELKELFFNRRKPPAGFSAQLDPHLHASSTGLLFLAHMSPQELTAYARAVELPQRDPLRAMDMERLSTRLATLNKKGVVINPPTPGRSDQELNAAVWDHQHAIVAVVSALVPTTANLAATADQLRRLQHSMVVSLGGAD